MTKQEIEPQQLLIKILGIRLSYLNLIKASIVEKPKKISFVSGKPKL